jgi:hypothetical protein
LTSSTAQSVTADEQLLDPVRRAGRIMSGEPPQISFAGDLPLALVVEAGQPWT